jgi:cytochrome P450
LNIFETHVQHLISTIPKDGSTIDIQNSFSSFALDISTEIYLGTSTNTLSSSELADNKGQKFAMAFDYAQRTLSGVEDLNLVTMVSKLLFGDRRLKESLVCIHEYVDQVLDQALTSLAANTNQRFDQQSSDTLFSHALLSEGRAREDVKYDILNIILAGKDTMSTYLSSVWYVLCQRPDVYEKVRDEISVLEGRPPGKEELNQFTYLRMVLQEGKFLRRILDISVPLHTLSSQLTYYEIVLRLYPPVAINQRTAEVDTILPHGGGSDGLSPIRVPQGTSVGYSVHAMHRIPEFFGEDATVFRPERWAEIRPTWAYMPFHAGPRTCIGRKCFRRFVDVQFE